MAANVEVAFPTAEEEEEEEEGHIEMRSYSDNSEQNDQFEFTDRAREGTSALGARSRWPMFSIGAFIAVKINIVILSAL
jgi:hypothetical protein